MRLAYCISVERRHAARESRAAPRGGGEEGERQDRQGLAALCVLRAESGTRAGRERWLACYTSNASVGLALRLVRARDWSWLCCTGCSAVPVQSAAWRAD